MWKKVISQAQIDRFRRGIDNWLTGQSMTVYTVVLLVTLFAFFMMGRDFANRQYRSLHNTHLETIRDLNRVIELQRRANDDMRLTVEAMKTQLRWKDKDGADEQSHRKEYGRQSAVAAGCD